MTAPLTSHSPFSLLPHKPLYSLRHNNIEVKPINYSRVATNIEANPPLGKGIIVFNLKHHS